MTQQTLQSELVTRTTAGSYNRVSDAPGSGSRLTGTAGEPDLFVFTDVSLGSDAIVGFNPVQDTIQLPTLLGPDFPTIQSKIQPNTTVNGTLIHFNSRQEIAIANVVPGALTATNFRFV